MLHCPCHKTSLCEISDYSAQGASSESDSEGDVPGQYCNGELWLCFWKSSIEQHTPEYVSYFFVGSLHTRV